jgi:hypothetical protein
MSSIRTLRLLMRYRRYAMRLLVLFAGLVEAERPDRMQAARELTRGVWQMVDEVNDVSTV